MLPAIPLLFSTASLVAGALGFKKGRDSKKILEEASFIGQEAEREYREAIAAIEEAREQVNINISNFAEYKKTLFLGTVGYVVEKIENSRSEITVFDESIGKISRKDIEDFDVQIAVESSSDLNVNRIFSLGAVKKLGVYSAIGIVPAPFFIIKGFILASDAEDARVEAEAYRQEVDQAIAELQVAKELLMGLEQKVKESEYFLNELNSSFACCRADYEKIYKRNKTLFFRLRYKIIGNQEKIKSYAEEQEKLTRLLAISIAIKKIIELPFLDYNGAIALDYQVKAKEIVKSANIKIVK